MTVQMPPPARVLAAFGAVGVPEPLAGGTGRSWLAGSLVLKPLDCAEHEIRWQAELFAAVEQDGSRFAAPLPDVVDGWTAAPDQPSQLIHGDLTGNVLFHDELPPAVIDFAPCCEPDGVRDRDRRHRRSAVEGAPEDLLGEAHPHYLVRARIYRGVTSLELGTDEWRPTFELARRIARCWLR